MKRYLIVTVSIFTLCAFYFIMSYMFGFYINFDNTVISFTQSDDTNIYVNNKEFTVKGVNLGSGKPGYYATEFAITKDEYLNWFSEIQEMGANTIRVYTIESPDFYNAFYEYNINNSNPLYLIHGVWVDDYVLNSTSDAYDVNFFNRLISDSKKMIDVVHGRRFIGENEYYSNGLYTKDISKWVIGYIIGVEWEDITVEYTNQKYSDKTYDGVYVKSKDTASAFEVMLSEVLDKVIIYESNKYNSQRLTAVSNWPTTDPFDYSEEIEYYFQKCSKVDVENIEFKSNFIGGTFASYHVYPYYPDYLNYEEDKSEYIDLDGNINTYYAYLKKLNNYHTIPVLISEFGVSTGRGMAQKDSNTNYNQGNMTEDEQGEALVSMYNSIINAGSVGGIVFTWQDEWFKRTWNTMQNVDLLYTPYWSDYQTNEQYFGLLSFDPGEDESISYNDGDTSEWSESDKIIDNSNYSLSVKYDEKYIYLFANIKDYNNETFYIPIDITDNSGSTTNDINDSTYNRDIDFLIEINKNSESRIYVQEYYDSNLAMYSNEILGTSIYYNPPEKNTKKFNKINLTLQTAVFFKNYNKSNKSNTNDLMEVYETGVLKLGNGNPNSQYFDNLSDYYINGDNIEIRIPYQLLNFSNPSKMTIHDDYYKNYGIENKKIDSIYIGLDTKYGNNDLAKFNLKGWNNKVTYHERLKKSYYILKDYWGGK